MIGRKSDEQRLRELALDFDAKQGRSPAESKAAVDGASVVAHRHNVRASRRHMDLAELCKLTEFASPPEAPVEPVVAPLAPKDVALKFAADMFGKEDEAAETALQVACAFIGERKFDAEFSVFVDSELQSYEEHRIGMYEADLDPDEPSVEHLRERVKRLEGWLANAKRDLADYEAWQTRQEKP